MEMSGAAREYLERVTEEQCPLVLRAVFTFVGLWTVTVWLFRLWNNIMRSWRKFVVSVKAKKKEESGGAKVDFGRQGGYYRMKFGKYKGSRLFEVPPAYVGWLLKQGIMEKHVELYHNYKTMMEKECDLKDSIKYF